MAEREILVLGDDRLRFKAKKISRFDDSLQALIDDMFDTLYAANGLGLAAPQIGVPLRVLIIEVPEERDEEGELVEPKQTYVLCNPEIVKTRGEEDVEEACLSVPGYIGKVRRATDVVIKGQDAKGRRVRYRGKDLLAQAFQHELDHLDGVLYVDRVESPENLWRVVSSEEEAEAVQDSGTEPIQSIEN
jgi:peptide deformylase